MPRPLVVDPGAEAADHPVVDEPVDPRVRVCPETCTRSATDRTEARPSVCSSLRMSRSMASSGRGGGAPVGMPFALEGLVGHLAVGPAERSAECLGQAFRPGPRPWRRPEPRSDRRPFVHPPCPPASLRWTTCSYPRLWRTVCPQAGGACSQNASTTEQSVGEARHTRATRLRVLCPLPRGGGLVATAQFDSPRAARCRSRLPAHPAAGVAAAYRPRPAAARRRAAARARHGRRGRRRPRAAAPAVRGADPRPPVQHAGHRAHQAGPARRLPVHHRPGGVRDRRRPGPGGAGLALPLVPRHPGGGRPRP
ncbi:hypothetical protein SNARM312S_05528 [Streptomyces narbonensis]